MISDKQLRANRKNAMKSTGPRTEAGMSIASKNAIKHGLQAAEIVIPGEDPSEFDSFRQALLADLSPVGQLEVMLADRIVGSLWKLRRSGRMEKELYFALMSPDFSEAQADDKAKHFVYEISGTNPDGTTEIINRTNWVMKGGKAEMVMPKPDVPESSNLPKTLRSLGSIALHDLTSSNILSRFRRYEAQIERSLYRALTELHRQKWFRQKDNLINEGGP